MAEDVLYERSGSVAYVTLNRPDRMNALGPGVKAGLVDAFKKVRQDPSVRVAVMTGAGNKAFCAGADLKERAAKQTPNVDPSTCPLDELPRSDTIVLETYKPVIAAVNGYALAGGCEMALACDIRIASENAVFGLTEATRGMGANFASIMLQYVVPRGIAMQMLFTGDHMTAQDALRYGLVNEVVTQSELMPRASALAEKIAKNAPLSLRRMKELAVKSLGIPLAAAVRMGPGPSPYESEDSIEGARAFGEKRSPVWKGR
jgi:enoyl-CoA hydratase/carnithine racemase